MAGRPVSIIQLDLKKLKQEKSVTVKPFDTTTNLDQKIEEVVNYYPNSGWVKGQNLIGSKRLTTT